MQNQFIFIFFKLKLLHHFIFCRTANGQVRSGYVYNWTSWLDDYGFGKCIDKAKCNVFPDGRPFPQSNDWRRKSYVYVWHTMGEKFTSLHVHRIQKEKEEHLNQLSLSLLFVPGQYYETCDGSSSSVTINTTNIPLGAEVMEVMIYRKRERRKYSPLSTDNTVFFVTGGNNKYSAYTVLSVYMFQPNRDTNRQKPNTSFTLFLRTPLDKIPVAVDISQKGAVNQSENIFIRGEDVVFKVHLHDPSGYLKTAASIDYIWDFRDGNQLVTHRNVTTHAYSKLGTMTVKLVVEAAFPVECPPSANTPTSTTSTGSVTSSHRDIENKQSIIWRLVNFFIQTL